MKPLYSKVISHKSTLKPLRENLAHNLSNYRKTVRTDGLGSTRELLEYGLVLGSAQQILYASIMLDKLIKENKLKGVDLYSE